MPGEKPAILAIAAFDPAFNFIWFAGIERTSPVGCRGLAIIGMEGFGIGDGLIVPRADVVVPAFIESSLTPSARLIQTSWGRVSARWQAAPRSRDCFDDGELDLLAGSDVEHDADHPFRFARGIAVDTAVRRQPPPRTIRLGDAVFRLVGHMGNLKKKRRLKMNKHKRRKRLKSNRHKKRTWQK